MADETTIITDGTLSAEEIAAANENLQQYAATLDRAKYSQDQLNVSQKTGAEQASKLSDAHKNLSIANNDAAISSSKLAQESNGLLKTLNQLASKTGDQFKNIQTLLGSSSEAIENFNNRSRASQESFALMSTAAISAFGGIKEAYNSLGGINLGEINLISDEVNADQFVGDVLKKFNTLGVKGIETFFSTTFGREIGNAAKSKAEEGIESLSVFAKSIFNSIDNVRRLTAAQIQLSSATGNLSAFYDAAGIDLENLGAITDAQNNRIRITSGLYGKDTKTIEQYWATLGKLPGALNSNIRGYDDSVSSLSTLEGAMMLATGTGRTFAEVTEDMHSAIRFGVSGMDEAIDFTSRISEITNNYGLELKDVRDHIINLGNSFKFFGNQAEGATTLVNHYVGAIKQTGVSGNVALEIVGQMTSGIKDLSLAQKAFLSAQTGGAGGLMGAFQIEKELREGGIDKVFEKVCDSMKKQMGNIVSLDEAASSREAAAQLTKQIQILKSGPLGSFAKDDQSAIRILEGFKNLESGKTIVKDLETSDKDGRGRSDVTNKLMERGNQLLQMNNDLLSQQNRSFEMLSGSSQAGIFSAMQRTIGGNSAGTIQSQNNNEMMEDQISQQRIASMTDRQEILRRSRDENLEMLQGAMRGEQVTSNISNNSGLSVQNLIDTSDETISSINSILNVTKSTVQEAMYAIQQLSSSNENKIKTEDELQQKSIELIKNSQKAGLSENQFAKLISSANKGNDTSINDLNKLSTGNTILRPQTFENLPTLSAENREFINNQNLNDLGASAARRASEAVSKDQLSKQNKERLNARVNEETGQIEVLNKIEVQGICIDCGRKTDSSHTHTLGIPSR